MGKAVTVLEVRGGDSHHQVRALLPDLHEKSVMPILFLLTSLAFLEASPQGEGEDGALSADYAEVDGWTPADFLSHLRFEAGRVVLHLENVRGRSVRTRMEMTPLGELFVETWARGTSATRWLAYVRGRSHLAEVPPGEA